MDGHFLPSQSLLELVCPPSPSYRSSAFVSLTLCGWAAATFAQAFFAWRILVLSQAQKRWIALVVFIAALSITQMLGGIIAGAVVSQNSTSVIFSRPPAPSVLSCCIPSCLPSCCITNFTWCSFGVPEIARTTARQPSLAIREVKTDFRESLVGRECRLRSHHRSVLDLPCTSLSSITSYLLLFSSSCSLSSLLPPPIHPACLTHFIASTPQYLILTSFRLLALISAAAIGASCISNA